MPATARLHLIKLCVGVADMRELKDWIRACRQGRDTLDHVTRMYPSRAAELLPGGSLYWVIRGVIACRQPLKALEPVTGADGIQRCRIVFKPQIIAVRPSPRRAFQGWRYLPVEDAPPDLASMGAASGMPPAMRQELAMLGLI